MKNLTIISFFIIFLFGCKEDLLTHEPDELLVSKLHGDRLKFDGEHDFLTFMISEGRNAEKNGYPLRKAHNQPNHLVDDIPDELLKILNEDNIFQVENWIIKLNFETRRVWVMDESFIHKFYDDFLSEVSTNPNIMNFSMDYDVFELLSQGYVNDPEVVHDLVQIGDEDFISLGIFCGGGTSSGETSATVNNIIVNQSGVVVNVSLQAISQYKKFGVWFELSSVGRVFESRFQPSGIVFSLSYDIDWKRRQNCRNGNEREGREIGSANISFPNPFQPNVQHKVTVYNSTRGLSKLRMESAWT